MFCIPISRSLQTPILVLCAQRWLISLQQHQQSFGMTTGRQACFMKPSQHIQLNEDYYTHYFLYYTYYFGCLSRIQQLVTSTYALQADTQRIYEVHHAIESRRKLSLLSHGPYLCRSLLFYTHCFTIISLLYVLFQNWKRRLGAHSLQKICQSAH